ncbi:efflux RND transporter permease subunit [Oleiagrimonas sp. MCCC 1A03011]|uniref:efflux RND transporter permease subunit n=1 Tax=Oleiagrimonas sp. MCCC 1A03011 TaxID=1926883 RepID=UPI000DC2B8AD|nr:efflux RND transporter permease subunit [Oleiagrimonas sp. MCCC 1A03011]RAP57072.1 multidrug efflux protein [Oleiagrimonas sp. MCCC 1A03011]
MNFTDVFIKKPVLAIVVSLLILVLGIKAVSSLTVRQYPKTENATVTVTTAYYGADAQTMAGFVTQPLEQAISQAQGIDYLSSSSTQGVSTITATLRLNYDANRALTEITTQVNSVKNQLPPQAQQPVLTVQTGQTIDAMYMGFYSDVLPTNKITDYLARVVKPKLDAVEGVQTAELLGARKFALRAWLDPAKMAARGVTASDVQQALAANNYLAAVGSSKGQAVTVDLTTDSNLHTVDEFKHLAIKQVDGSIVRLQDIAKVELGSENYNFNVAFNGKRSVFIGIKVAPNANVLDVAKRVRDTFPDIQQQLPNGLTGEIVYDGTKFVNSSIDEVVKTLIEALVIVTVVIFLFLGSLRAVIIPVVAIPLSLVGTFFMMLALGYSINLLTLLALVLAIGLVVDDAIIVVENVDRHMKEEHKTPLQSALLAARELGGPILAMTVVLIAVYVPIGFQQGLTGALFTEFAFTLAGAVTVSAVVALTLSPMMTSRFFHSDQKDARLAQFIDRQFTRVQNRYRRMLSNVLTTKSVIIVMSVLLLLATIALGMTAQSELAPEEDQGVVLGQIVGAPNTTAQQMNVYAEQMFEDAKTLPEYDQMFQLTGVPTVNQGIGGVLLKPWEQRDRSAHELQQVLQQKWNNIAGAQVAAFQFPALPGAQGLPIQVVITTTEPFQNLNEVASKVLSEAQASGKFYFIDSDLKVDKPQSTVKLDRDMITSLGLTQQDVGAALGAALGGGYVNYFSISGRSYRVIPQVLQVDRLNPDQVLDYYIRAPDGSVIQASTVAKVANEVVPRSLNHFQQLNSATISGVSGMSQGEALTYLRDLVKKVAPTGYNVDYSGQSRQFMKESGGFAGTLFFAVIIVFLALAAQFNSLRDPVVILVSVPLALFGALIFVNLFASLNIYTEVGLVTLMGLISKHGILMVEFANQSQLEGMSKRDAILHAASVRLRPILMTTAAMVLGVLPLVIATGAGAAGRFNMGLVISTGLAIGTLFTLFVVPAFYLLLSTDHHADKQDGDPQRLTAEA